MVLATQNFNPRSPSGLRQNSNGAVHVVNAYFNPRSPSGLRRQPLDSQTLQHLISIHAARVGCDSNTGAVDIDYMAISIHAARVGCD